MSLRVAFYQWQTKSWWVNTPVPSSLRWDNSEVCVLYYLPPQEEASVVHHVTNIRTHPAMASFPPCFTSPLELRWLVGLSSKLTTCTQILSISVSARLQLSPFGLQMRNQQWKWCSLMGKNVASEVRGLDPKPGSPPDCGLECILNLWFLLSKIGLIAHMVIIRITLIKSFPHNIQ